LNTSGRHTVASGHVIRERSHSTRFRMQDIFVRENEGETLVHAVAKRVYADQIVASENAKDFVESSKLLMQMGLNAMVEDNNQRTALVSWLY